MSATAFADYAEPEAILASAPDLAVLDVLLPSGDGFELAHELRVMRELPIVFLTARDAVSDRLHVFELGADDYMVKPFALEELLARVRAVLVRGHHIEAALARDATDSAASSVTCSHSHASMLPAETTPSSTSRRSPPTPSPKRIDPRTAAPSHSPTARPAR